MQQINKCPNCGARNDIGFVFCGTCGSRLTSQTQQQPPSQQQPPPQQHDEQIKALSRNTKIQGVNGQIELLVNTLRISRKGQFPFFTKGGKKEISLSQISTIRFKEAGSIAHGYIQISYTDENTIMFDAEQEPSFASIKEEIDKRMEKSKKDTRRSSDLDDIEKLASLRVKGIITDDEFNVKKRQILGM